MTLETEIKEQAELLDRFGENEINQIEKVAQIITDVNASKGSVFLFASGSSLNACMYARELFSRDNDITLEVFPAGEAENHVDDIKQDDLVVLVSQSGESKDILETDKLIDESVKKAVVTNNIKSKLAEGADIVIDIKAGEEKAVPATKTYFATLLVFTILSEVLKGGIKMNKDDIQIIEEIDGDIPKGLADKKIFILGSGVMWPQAMESELKFKEIARAEVEAYELSEFMHGPQTMLNQNSVVIMLCPSSCGPDGVDFLDKVQQTGAKILAIGICDGEKPDYKIKLKSKKYYELIAIVVIQKLALEIAKINNINLEEVNDISKVVK